MKIRNGFVSNSSSSSFIIKSKHKSRDLLEQDIRKYFQVPKSYPISELTIIPDTIINSIEDSFKSLDDIRNYIKEHYGYENPQDIEDTLQSDFSNYVDDIKDGWTIYDGSFEDDHNGSIQSFLNNVSIKLTKSDLIIDYEGGY